MAAVGAAAIRVERPRERHPLDGIECGAADDFLIASRVGALHRFGERFGAAGFDRVRYLACRRFASPEIEKKGHFHSELSDLRLIFAMTISRYAGPSNQARPTLSLSAFGRVGRAWFVGPASLNRPSEFCASTPASHRASDRTRSQGASPWSVRVVRNSR